MEKCFRISYYGCLNTWKSVNRFVFKGVLDTPLVYFYPREQCIPHWPNECWLDSSQEPILHIIIYSCIKVEIFQDTCASHNMQIRGAGSFVSSIHMALCNIPIYGDIRTIIWSVYKRPAIICRRAVIPEIRARRVAVTDCERRDSSKAHVSLPLILLLCSCHITVKHT